MVKQHTALILVLCICTLTHEFADAARLRRSAVHQDAQNNDLFSEITAVDTFENKENKRQKRSVGAVIMGTALVVGASGLAFEAYLKSEGCCGLYGEICSNTRQYETVLDQVTVKSKAADENYLVAKNTLEYVEQCNDKNREIWVALKTIGELSETYINSLDPELMTRFNKKSEEIKIKVQKKNQTVMGLTYMQLSGEYQSLFDSTEGTLMALSGVLGNSLLIVGSYAYKQYQIGKIEATLKTDYGKKLQASANSKANKIFGIDKTTVQSHLKQTSKSVYKANMATSRMTNYMNGANHVLALASIGFEIYGAIQKVKLCETRRDQTRTALKEINKANVDIDVLDKNINNYTIFVNEEGWDYVKEQITGPQVMEILGDISKMIGDAGKEAKTSDLVNAKTTIDNFVKTISAASFAATYRLQNELIAALGSVSFVLDCHVQQLGLLNYVNTGCKAGHDSLDNLYASAEVLYPRLKSELCHDKAGTAYMTKTEVYEAVEITASLEGFHYDCVLNSQTNKDRACDLHYLGNTDAEIASQMSLSEEQVKFFTTSCPPRDFLLPLEETSICLYKRLGYTNAQIAQELKIEWLEDKVAAVAAACPTNPPTTTPPPPTALTEEERLKVCNLRGFGLPDASIAGILGYDLTLVQAAKC